MDGICRMLLATAELNKGEGAKDWIWISERIIIELNIRRALWNGY
jgi:hypothetical protein